MTKLYGALVGSVLLLSACGNGTGNGGASPDAASDTAETLPETTSTHRTGTILFLGNSLSAGLGVRQEEAFPSLIQARIDSLGWNFTVVNAGVSGDTSSGGLRRLEWLLRDTVDVLVVELGANDGLRGISPAAMRENLERIIDEARNRYPDVRILLAGMKMPPNLGQDYTRTFEEVYVTLADEKNVRLIPFLLEGVGGMRHLNQPDGVHPTAEGHRIIARTVWQYLRPVLEDMPFAQEPA